MEMLSAQPEDLGFIPEIYIVKEKGWGTLELAGPDRCKVPLLS